MVYERMSEHPQIAHKEEASERDAEADLAEGTEEAESLANLPIDVSIRTIHNSFSDNHGQ